MNRASYHELRRSEFLAKKALAEYRDGPHWNAWTARSLRNGAEQIRAPRNLVCWPEHTFNAQQANRRRHVMERIQARKRFQAARIRALRAA